MVAAWIVMGVIGVAIALTIVSDIMCGACCDKRKRAWAEKYYHKAVICDNCACTYRIDVPRGVQQDEHIRSVRETMACGQCDLKGVLRWATDTEVVFLDLAESFSRGPV